ncbi:hypothetical protein KC19_1G337300 [Ceratodon purpureus]|uniref:Uncharacterized protein n=1 Tax=Ceratodon purpureus TaxID=3225 RepID=A0A8T0JCA4_CERPU|nr:hypothetical protein KC19_1G337300 [Ceratodon purpureus]
MYSTCPLIQAPSLQADAQAKITARNIQRGTGRRKTRENRKSKDSFVGVPTQSVLLVLGKPGHLYTLSFEESFGSTTCRAQPIFWKITEQCACSHRICRVSLLFVVDVTAGSAFIGTGVTYGESSPILRKIINPCNMSQNQTSLYLNLTEIIGKKFCNLPMLPFPNSFTFTTYFHEN